MTGIRDILRELNIPFWEHGQSPLVSSGWVGVVCPYCDRGQRKAGLGVHVRTHRLTCWKCGGGKKLAAALSLASGRPFREVFQLLSGLVPERESEPAKAGKYHPPDGVGDFLPAHENYLRGRGFDPAHLASFWGLRGIGPGCGKYSWRVFIPVNDDYGTPVYWTARAIGEVPHGNRYRAAPPDRSAVPKSHALFGVEHIRNAVIITEGHFDALWGGPGFVATGGVGFSAAQVHRLAQVPTRTVLFDSGREAQRRAHDLAFRLAAFPGITNVAQTSGDDPATSPLSERDEIRRTYLDYPPPLTEGTVE